MIERRPDGAAAPRGNTGSAVAAAVEQREFHFSPRDFERVRKLIREHAGIALNDSKSNMVYSRLARRLRARPPALRGLPTPDLLPVQVRDCERAFVMLINLIADALPDNTDEARRLFQPDDVLERAGEFP
jgi:hypothetical protein